MATGRKWTEAERSALLAELRASGLSVYSFARAKRIAVSTLYGWKKPRTARRRSRSSSPGRPASKPARLPTSPMLPVRVVDAPPGPSPATPAETVILELCGGHRLLLRPGFPATEVAQLVRALESRAR